MAADITELKAALRREIRARLKAVTQEQRTMMSREICSRLQAQPAWNSALAILFFAPLPDEPDIWPLVKAALATGKMVALPRFFPSSQTYTAARVQDLQSDVRIGRFGIREPVESCREIPLTQLDLVLVPGVAFDFQGGRLGRGRGFYDRLLAGVGGMKCGVAFDEQIVSDIPAGPLDARVNRLVTPTRWIEA